MQVQAAISAVKYFRGLPKLPDNFPIPASRNGDIFDFLHYVFGFQVTLRFLEALCFLQFALCGLY